MSSPAASSAAAQRVEPRVSDVLDARASTDGSHAPRVGFLLLVGRRLGLGGLGVRLLAVSVGRRQPRLGGVALVARLDARLQFVEQRRTRAVLVDVTLLIILTDTTCCISIIHGRDVVQCDVMRQSAAIASWPIKRSNYFPFKKKISGFKCIMAFPGLCCPLWSTGDI